ncbi:unnamed protein product [Rotaria socialis]|uniref:Uncharacterized protein n=1 Tax=Rotaria socialis TaxID=392032 RepID=A0A817XMY1_9BILA|nr:unnamed protein product [Rotaria socialis]
MTDIDQEEWGNSSLFTSVSEVSNEETVAFSGTISKWLKRTLYRSGPGANEINNDSSISVNHAADGCAFIQKYAIDGSSQAVRFRTSFIKYRAYKEAIKHGHLTTRQFGTDPFRRFHLDLTTNKCIEPYAGARTSQVVYPISYANSLVPVQFELPRINPYHIGKSYRYFYAARSPPDRFLDALIKGEIESKKECAFWVETFTPPSEPIFVPKPHANGDNNSIEDDGVVLSVVLDQKRKQSFILVLDGSTFTELGRAYVSIHIPPSFHGNFY